MRLRAARYLVSAGWVAWSAGCSSRDRVETSALRTHEAVPIAKPVETLVLIQDLEQQLFAAFNAEGAIEVDLWPLLDTNEAADSVFISWNDDWYDGQNSNSATHTGVGLIYRGIPNTFPGHVVIGVPLTDGNTRVKLIDLDATVREQHVLPGHWSSLRLAPDHRYVAAYRDDPDVNVRRGDVSLMRMTDGEVIWTGRCGYSGFSPDGSHFLCLPGNLWEEPAPILVFNLTTGNHTSIDAEVQGQPLTTVWLHATSNFGSVLQSFTLLHLDWSGELAVAAPPSSGTIANYAGLGEGGKHVWWWRSDDTTGTPPLYEFDIETHEVRTIERPKSECPAPKGSHYLSAEDGNLMRCTCSTYECIEVIALPEVEGLMSGWHRQAWSSPSGRYAVLGYQTHTNGASGRPPSEMHLFDSDTVGFTSIPTGFFMFAPNEQLAVTTGFGLGIVALPSRKTTWFEGRFMAKLVYR